MDNLFRTLANYYSRSDFRKFQNIISREVYDTLGVSYFNSDGEVKMVTNICRTLNGKSFEKLKFYSKKIHGSRSFVEFQNQDKPVTKELADMVVISVATRKQQIVYEKTAFIQNKKENSDYNWKIDQDQLYLLHNFPSFKGAKGIFNKNFDNEVVFFNNSESLGNYGFFQNPGELILVNAKTVYKLQQGDNISLSDIRKINVNNSRNNSWFEVPLLEHPLWEEMWYHLLKYFNKYGISFMNLPFLGNCKVTLNIYEFIRNWTYFNIGEVASAFGNTLDKDLSIFTRILLKEVGLTNVMNLNIEGNEFENNLVILVAHLNLDEKG